MFTQTSTSEKDIEIKTKSDKTPLVGVFLVIASIAFYVFFLRGLSAQVSTLKADVSSKTTEVEEMKTQLAQFKNASGELELSTEVKRREILKSIPAAMQQDEVIRDLIHLAESSEIVLRSLSFGKGQTQGKEGIKSLRINASFEGNYSDLTDFLESIERNGRFLKVDSISVQIQKLEASEIKKAVFSLSMEAFYQNDNKK